jgi:GH18 family chitinase
VKIKSKFSITLFVKSGALHFPSMAQVKAGYWYFQSAYLDKYDIHYFWDGNTWIAYNGKKSITAKVQYARGDDQENLLGYFAWHLGADDVTDWTLLEAG